MSQSISALTIPLLLVPLQEPFPPEPPLFPMYGLGVVPVSYARVADLDGDGNADIVTAYLNANQPMRVHLGTGRGTFVRDAKPPVDLPVTPIIRGIELGDFDGDGDPEPAVVLDSVQGSRILVFDNDGTGNLSLKETLVYFATCDRLSVADVDGDGFDDLLFTREPDARINVQRSLGPGGFAPPSLLQSPSGYGGSVGYVVGDTSGDGFVDIVSLHGTNQRSLFQFVNDGAGGFMPPVELAQVDDTTSYSSLADLRGDGVLHLAAMTWDFSIGPKVTWFENDGAGSFDRRETFVGLSLISSVVDLDGDGREEWLALRSGSGLERLVARDDDLVLADQAPRGLLYFFVQAADFDSDGAQDLLLTDDSIFDGALAIARGDGAGELAGVVASPGEAGGDKATLLELDGNGDLDLVSFSPFTPRVIVYRGLGNGRFSRIQGTQTADVPQQVVAGDFDGNGIADIGVVEGSRRSVEILLQDSSGSFASAGSTRPTQRMPGGYLHAVALDSDGDGRDEVALLDPYRQRLALVGLDGEGTTALLAALQVPGTREIHGVVEIEGDGTDALELIADGSATYLSLWLLHQPLAKGKTRLTERLPLPVVDPAAAQPAVLADGIRVQDLDGDGSRDVWAVYNLVDFYGPYQSASSEWYGSVSAGFGQPDCERSPLISVPRWTADLDGDGLTERAFLYNAQGYNLPNRLLVRRGGVGAALSDPEAYAVGDAANGDVNGDGREDLVFVFGDWVYTLLNLSGP